MEHHAALALIFLAFTLYALAGPRLEKSMLSGPIIFTVIGLAFYWFKLPVLSDADNSIIEFLATGTLVIILFRDAASIRFSNVLAERRIAMLTLRLLLVGIPLTIMAGAGAALIFFPGLGLAAAIVVAILLTPTDAALAQPVFDDESLPEIPREALDAESGLNDGLCLPLLLIVLGFATQAGGTGLAQHLGFFASQVLFGPLVGLVVGWLGAAALSRMVHGNAAFSSGRTPIMVALAGLAYFAAELVHGNGFLAAFVAGITFGFQLPRPLVERASSFAGTEGVLLTNVTFLLFGAVMLPRALQVDGLDVFVYAILSLTLIRMVPVALASIGSGIGMGGTAFMGWFGPRGLASVLYLLLVVEQSGFASADMVADITVVTIALSILLHGISSPFAHGMFFGRGKVSGGGSLGAAR
ncbi:cation:proton antiporter [Nitratireductor basaltis]|uniref:NhaP-type Na+/H+ and K+/H+ antiporter protein n=1 Tax=Nitratireductor basaltis TaxID=472175 RepID=A0A084UEH3_9HYPH|nr:cation:proton antiporter [Nitratireductor basaltis]KFB11359.1 NhaP-type Na+/H+ and K+/H+ antiporter protein [Nitratireductor basaltis]